MQFRVQLSVHFTKVKLLDTVNVMFLKEGNVLFNDSHIFIHDNVRYMVKDHIDNESGNLLLPLHRLLSTVSSNGSFICITPQTG